MTIQQTETIQRLWDRFIRDQLAGLPPRSAGNTNSSSRIALPSWCEKGADAPSGGDGFLDLHRLRRQGPRRLRGDGVSLCQAGLRRQRRAEPAARRGRALLHLPIRALESVPGRRRAAAPVPARHVYAFNAGPARAASTFWRSGSRCAIRRGIARSAYRRAFNYGNNPPPAGAVVNRNFHRQLVGFMVSLAQYFRDLLIGEVIRGGQMIEQRPFGSVATVQRLGLDLRYALDRATYGNIYSLAIETGHYLKQVLNLLDAPDIKKAFDANTKWNVVEIVSQRYLGGMAEISQRAKMAESGRRILQFVADHDFKTGDRPVAVPIRDAADGPACRSLARRLSHDPRRPRFRRGHAGTGGVLGAGGQ